MVLFRFSYPYCSTERKRAEIKAVCGSNVDLSSGVVPSGYSQGTSLCATFFDGLWRAKRKGKKSPIEVFEDDGLLRHAIGDCIRHRKKLTDSVLRSELQTFGGVHNFRPVVAKAIYNEFGVIGGSMLDPCAGWGGRLLGFLFSGLNKYVGIDVESDTIRGLRMMSKMLGDGKKDVQIMNCPFEDWQTDEEFDLVFTSPPYYDAEWYGPSPLQSSFRYQTYQEWLERFLFVLVDKSIEFLRPGGNLILNVANTRDVPVADDLREYLSRTIGIERELRMLLSSMYGEKPRYEPIFVCHKSH